MSTYDPKTNKMISRAECPELTASGPEEVTACPLLAVIWRGL